MEELEKQETELKPEKKKKKKSVLAIFFNKNKIGFFILVFFTLVANAFAWFIYSQIVSVEISAGVKAWNITMNGEKDGVLTFTLDDLDPGMQTYNETVTIANTGDLDARVTFTIHSITVMGETYTIESGTYQNNPTALQNFINTTYPFTISYTANDDVIVAETGELVLNLSVVWPYESGDDAKDTYWGEKAYEFAQEHPGEDMLFITLDVNVVQIAS